MTIRNRLLATYLALTGTGMVLLATVAILSFQEYFMESVRDDLEARATAVSQSVMDWMEQGNEKRVALVVERYGAQEDVEVRVFDQNGRLLASSARGDHQRGPQLLALAGVQTALAGVRNRGRAEGVLDGGDRMYEALPLERGGVRMGVMRMSRALTQFQEEMSKAVLTMAGLLLVAFAVATAVSVQLARHLARPIQRMRDFAISLGRGRFDQRLDLVRKDELGTLATELNRMSERLAALDEERRSFLASASHELRTPVSNVHVTLEALESGAAEDPALRARFLSTALAETSRMVGLIQDLLDLGRLEAGVSPLDRQATTVRHLVERLARAMEPRLRAADIRIDAVAEEIPVSVDPERMLQALLNLLDNALKFAPAGSTVTIRSQIEGERAVLTVADQGCGIDPTDLPRVFDQFWSGDPSRRRGGTGLGLAIARKIVEGHGGTISVTSALGAGATFEISLPIRAA